MQGERGLLHWFSVGREEVNAAEGCKIDVVDGVTLDVVRTNDSLIPVQFPLVVWRLWEVSRSS